MGSVFSNIKTLKKIKKNKMVFHSIYSGSGSIDPFGNITYFKNKKMEKEQLMELGKKTDTQTPPTRPRTNAEEQIQLKEIKELETELAQARKEMDDKIVELFNIYRKYSEHMVSLYNHLKLKENEQQDI